MDGQIVRLSDGRRQGRCIRGRSARVGVAHAPLPLAAPRQRTVGGRLAYELGWLETEAPLLVASSNSAAAPSRRVGPYSSAAWPGDTWRDGGILLAQGDGVARIALEAHAARRVTQSHQGQDLAIVPRRSLPRRRTGTPRSRRPSHGSGPTPPRDPPRQSGTTRSRQNGL